jgi:N-acetyl-gamma-glutamyl-phosphate reductase
MGGEQRMSVKVFIDGSAGTTGLRIADRLAARPEIELLSISEVGRKDVNERAKVINSADLAFLCLPDAASREVMPLLRPDVKVLDTSTAFRTDPNWVYGFPELRGQKEKIKNACRVAVPGCYASGFISIMRPLVELGLAGASDFYSCTGISGYSGGGKKMIAEYRAPERSPLLNAPRQYALGQTHKHLKEMKAVTGLASEPVFCPVVADFYSGMQVTVPLFAGWLKPGAGMEEVKNAYKALYTGPVVSYTDAADEGSFLSAAAQSGLDSMKITVAGNEQRMLLLAVYDNLGKGASGAAVECMNLVTGAEKTLGLEL